ncbi:hypothetical protein IscW_ISCW006415 [Ixodes scapularis]|uniref:Uncharacterized protein n=1 Tax=Ixodes scapularis TaxID=6945 RepID=B7PLH4_IXOSC|nr:hypothetical protein IscW_ISCW006415 [Ixodes scapularis]|eukprot:XP_002434622.1 hypothetical protein IscW_ISCW006415 [Ixodes scapularis]
MTSVQSEDVASHGSDLDQRTQTPDEVAVVHDAAPAEVLANGADVPAGLERQVDGASCSESLSSFESEMTLAEKLGKRIQSTSRKLRVLDRPTLNSGTLRKPGGSFQVVVGSSSSAGTRKGKKYSCERIRQLESEVWLAERELLLLKEKVSARHCTPSFTLRRIARGAASHPKTTLYKAVVASHKIQTSDASR